MSDWKLKDNRFVAFFDILGFRDLVSRNTHDTIFEKLNHLKTETEKLNRLDVRGVVLDEVTDQTRSVTFSDSLIFFSKSDSPEDASKIIVDSFILLRSAFEQNIPIKGAISFGEISVDFEKSIFFGQPIIDAYLLHEDLKMLTVICDHKSENKFNNYNFDQFLKAILIAYNAHMSYGRTTHTLFGCPDGRQLKQKIKNLNELYKDTSGKPRVYLDNTREFLEFLEKLEEQKSK